MENFSWKGKISIRHFDNWYLYKYNKDVRKVLQEYITFFVLFCYKITLFYKQYAHEGRIEPAMSKKKHYIISSFIYYSAINMFYKQLSQRTIHLK